MERNLCVTLVIYQESDLVCYGQLFCSVNFDTYPVNGRNVLQ